MTFHVTNETRLGVCDFQSHKLGVCDFQCHKPLKGNCFFQRIGCFYITLNETGLYFSLNGGLPDVLKIKKKRYKKIKIVTDFFQTSVFTRRLSQTKFGLHAAHRAFHQSPPTPTGPRYNFASAHSFLRGAVVPTASTTHESTAPPTPQNVSFQTFRPAASAGRKRHTRKNQPRQTTGGCIVSRLIQRY